MTRLYTNAVMQQHLTGRHPECPGRLDSIDRRLSASLPAGVVRQTSWSQLTHPSCNAFTPLLTSSKSKHFVKRVAEHWTPIRSSVNGPTRSLAWLLVPWSMRSTMSSTATIPMPSAWFDHRDIMPWQNEPWGFACSTMLLLLRSMLCRKRS